MNEKSMFYLKEKVILIFKNSTRLTFLYQITRVIKKLRKPLQNFIINIWAYCF